MSSSDTSLSSILARLDALEAGIASEGLQPTYQTITPSGQIGANFTGHVHAQGLDLSAGTVGTPPTSDRIRWLRDSDGKVVADIFADQVSATDESIVTTLYDANDNSTPLRGELGLVAIPGGSGQPDNPGVSLIATCSLDGVIGSQVNMLRWDGASDFIRTTRVNRSGTIKQLALDGGTAVINFPNAQAATPLVVNHGLGRTPQSIQITTTNGPLTNLFAFSSNGGNANNLTIYAFSSVVINGNVGLSWLALG